MATSKLDKKVKNKAYDGEGGLYIDVHASLPGLTPPRHFPEFRTHASEA